MFQRVLWAVDGSEHALNAGRFAYALGFLKDAEVDIRSAFDASSPTLPALGGISREALDGLRNSVRDRCLIPAEKLLQSLEVKTGASLVQEGPPAEYILNEAERINADLIVIGRRGLGAIKRFFAGSVSLRVALGTPCPILIVPEALPEVAANKPHLVLPTDFSESAQQGVAFGADIAEMLGAEVFLVHAFLPYEVFPSGYPESPAVAQEFGWLKDHAQKELKGLVRHFTERKISAHSMITARGAVASITEAAEQNQASLVIMSSHGRGGWSRFWLGSTTDKLIKKGCVPILLVPTSEEEQEEKQDALATP